MKKNIIGIALPLIIVIIFVTIILILINDTAENADVKNQNSVDVSQVISSTPEIDDDKVKNDGSLWLYLTLIIMSLTTVLSVAISFYLYKWRRILINNSNLIVPEEWGKYLGKVGDGMEVLGSAFTKSMNHVASETSENSKKITNMTETYMSLQDTLDKKDSEIQRLKKGYDAEIFRKFLSRFIRIDQTVDDCILLNKDNSDAFEQLKRLFEDAFDECGVERFSPEIGEDYRRAFGVADHPKKVMTDIKKEDFNIAEILEYGYKLRKGNDFEIIMPSKVSINKYEG